MRARELAIALWLVSQASALRAECMLISEDIAQLEVHACISSRHRIDWASLSHYTNESLSTLERASEHVVVIRARPVGDLVLPEGVPYPANELGHPRRIYPDGSAREFAIVVTTLESCQAAWSGRSVAVFVESPVNSCCRCLIGWDREAPQCVLELPIVRPIEGAP